MYSFLDSQIFELHKLYSTCVFIEALVPSLESQLLPYFVSHFLTLVGMGKSL